VHYIGSYLLSPSLTIHYTHYALALKKLQSTDPSSKKTIESQAIPGRWFTTVPVMRAHSETVHQISYSLSPSLVGVNRKRRLPFLAYFYLTYCMCVASHVISTSLTESHSTYCYGLPRGISQQEMRRRRVIVSRSRTNKLQLMGDFSLRGCNFDMDACNPSTRLEPPGIIQDHIYIWPGDPF